MRNMCDVVLSNTYYYKFDSKQWANKQPYPPLGTLYAASFLRSKNYKVSVFDTNLLNNPELIKPFLKKQTPKLFVIYDDGFNYLTKMCLTVMREAAFKKISIAKQFGCFIAVSSSDATDHAEKYLDAGADVIIKGEGELTLEALTNAVLTNRNLNSIEGIIFKENHKLVTNKPRTVLKDLDVLPMPAWDLISIDPYKKIWETGGRPFTLNIATTRGCPFKCNWCAKPIYGNRYNSHSPEYITKHLNYLNQTYGVSRFWMCDDIFGLKPNWVQEFNLELHKAKLKVTYFIQSRVDLLLKEDTIDALAKSGLEEVWVGAESGSQVILDAMDKDTKVSQIYHATRLLKEKAIKVAFFIQFGYLNETKKDIELTIKMIKDLLPDNIGISVSYPLPGTKFYDIVKDDLKLKANWTDSDDLAMLFKGTYSSKYYKKLQRYVHKLYRKHQGLFFLKSVTNKKLKTNWRLIALLPYYTFAASLDKLQLNKLQHHES